MSDDINIDDIIDEIDFEENQENESLVVSGSKEVENEGEKTPDVTEEDEMMKFVVNMTIEDRQKADDFYNIFVPDVSTGRDRSEGSKEAMAKALELKISSAKNIIDLIKLKKNNDKGNNVGIFFGETMNGKKAGINIDNIKREI